ncbi:hypothetical protein B0H19DRAFT_184053 [Mycena capillaripes]|nr:hypothetical protein B0H19DRAFT_184053 [Mycena capillaripes]
MFSCITSRTDLIPLCSGSHLYQLNSAIFLSIVSNMRPIHAAFKSLTLLVLLAAGTRADEEADYQASVECANNRPGSPPQAMFANNNDRSCQCMPAATNNGAWTKCPAPAGSPRTGLAICVTGAGCRIECAQDAIPINGTCISYNMAPGAQIKTLTDEDCARAPDADPTDVIGAYQGGSCLCKAPNWHTMDGGSVCKQGIPENAFATCSRALRDDREVGDSYCSFQCKPGFRPSDDQESCIAGAAPAEEATGSDNNNADLAPSCPEVKSISYSSLNARCGCESRMALAKRRTPDATQCRTPAQFPSGLIWGS